MTTRMGFPFTDRFKRFVIGVLTSLPIGELDFARWCRRRFGP